MFGYVYVGMVSVDEELLEILLEPGMDDGAEEGKTIN